MSGEINNITVAIASSASLSAGIPIGDKVAIGVMMSAAWDAAALTFQVSADNGTTFDNVYDSSGNELTVQTAAGRYVYFDPTAFVGVNYLKIRSGTSGTPVNQTAARSLVLVTR